MAYRTPGVYVEEISLFPPSVAEVKTAVPAFIGYTKKATRRGRDLMNIPTKLRSLLEFRDIFGGEYAVKRIEVKVNENNNHAVVGRAIAQKRFYMFEALRLYFDNGGGECYIISVGDYDASVSAGALTTGLAKLKKQDEPTIILFPDAVLLEDDDQFATLQQAALAQCADLQDRVAVFDLRENVKPNGKLRTLGQQQNEQERRFDKSVEVFRNKIGINNLKYGAAYTPWLVAAYDKEVDFEVFSAHVMDRADNPVVLDQFSPDPALNDLVARTNVALKDKGTLAGRLVVLRTAGGTVLSTPADRLAALMKALQATTTEADAKTAFTALRAWLRSVAVDPPAWIALLNGVNLTRDLHAYAKDRLRSGVEGLIALEKQQHVGTLTGENEAAVSAAYKVYDDNASDWLSKKAVDILKLPDDAFPDATRDSALKMAATGAALFEELNKFLDDIVEAADTHKRLAQVTMYQGHPVISGIVEHIKREMKYVPPSGAKPTFTIKIDGSDVNSEYQIQAVIVTREFNRVARAEIRILDGDAATEAFKASDAEDFLPGKQVEILAGYHGEEEPIFKGLVVRHGIRVYQHKPSVLRVECQDAAVKMTIGRKSAYFYEVTDSDVIEQIAADAGIDTDIEATSVTHRQMVQFYATDWDFVVARAEANGKLVATRDGTLTVKAPDPGGDPVLTLTYGGNILDFEAAMDARRQYAAVQSFAWAAADQEMTEIDAADERSVSPGNVDSGDLASVVGLDAFALKHGGELADDELQAWADAEQVKSLFAKVCGRVRIQGFAGVYPGDIVEMAGVGERFTGNALVSGVRHEINTKNWETDIGFGLSTDFFGSRVRDVTEAPAAGLLPAISGLQIGLVTALEGDPDGAHRVQVRIPMIDPAEEGIWARVSTLDAGDGRGTFWRPEIGDEVVLGFLNDDPRAPILLGMMHSSAKPAPLEGADDNHEKGIVTRSDIKVMFNDDTVVVFIETPNGNTVTLSDDKGGIFMKDENGNTLTMNADGITLKSAADITFIASGDITSQGTNITSAASAELKGEGSVGAELSSGGSTVVKGSVVQIN